MPIKPLKLKFRERERERERAVEKGDSGRLVLRSLRMGVRMMTARG
jgi:hypothetical protein